MDPVFDYGRGAVPGTTASGCGSITGGAFVPNGIWPAGYDGTYLFADFVCGWIFRLSAAGPYTAADFATSLGGSSATSLAFGPYGTTQALYYTTYAAGGQVRRIAYALPGNNPPVAVASGSPLTGPVPLTVTFSAAGSIDPDPADTLTYFWTFGDGGPEQSTASLTLQHTYAVAGTYTATLRVRDDKLAFSAPATVLVQPGNTPPVATIQSPAPGATFAVGQAVTLTGTGTDVQDGTLPASRLSWTVLLHHDTHVHPFLGPVTGNDVVFTAPAPEDLAAAATSYLEVQLTATDLSGATHTVTRDLLPKKVDVTFATTPPGLSVSVNGFPLTGPADRDLLAGLGAAGHRTLVASERARHVRLLVVVERGRQPRRGHDPGVAGDLHRDVPALEDAGPQDYFTVAPCRLVDTRDAGGSARRARARRGRRRAMFDVRGACAIPTTARALALNVTVTGSTGARTPSPLGAGRAEPGHQHGQLRDRPDPREQRRLRLGAAGSVSVFCSMASGTAHLVVDVIGYFE